MYLVFDVTPIQKPNDYNAAFSDTNAWPRMFHLSWIVLNEQMKPIEDYDCVIKPENFEVSDSLLKRAKLEEEEVQKKSEDLESVLKAFSSSVEKCTYILAHNVGVYENIIAAECMRKGIHPNLFSKERICLMHESTFHCKIPSRRGDGYKWPTLQELYQKLFHQRYAPAGNARADVIAATRSFIMLYKVGALEDLFDDA